MAFLSIQKTSCMHCGSAAQPTTSLFHWLSKERRCYYSSSTTIQRPLSAAFIRDSVDSICIEGTIRI